MLSSRPSVAPTFRPPSSTPNPYTTVNTPRSISITDMARRSKGSSSVMISAASFRSAASIFARLSVLPSAARAAFSLAARRSTVRRRALAITPAISLATDSASITRWLS